MTVISIFWLIILAFFVFYIFQHDIKVRNSEEYKVAIQNKTKPRKKLLIKRWWAWLLILFMLILSLAANSGEDDDSEDGSTAKTEETHKLHKQSNKHITKKSHKQNSHEAKKRKILKLLNMWAAKNNSYGVVKIDKDDAPMLILNDKTAAASKSELKSIAIQFANKIRVQQQMNHIELDNPAIYDKDGTPIAVWNGSTLELTDK